MRVVPTSVSNVVTTSLSDVIKTLPQRCCNVATTFSIGELECPSAGELKEARLVLRLTLNEKHSFEYLYNIF